MPQPRYYFDAIGTKWSIDTDQPLSHAEKLDITNTIEEFTAAYSRFRDDSLVTRLYTKNISTPFPDSIDELLGIYAQLNCLSHGAINPLVGVSLVQLGYDATYSLKARAPVAAPELAATLTLHKNHTITLTKPALLDIGAIGKGYLVDKIAEIVARRHTNYVIDGSGDLAVRQAKEEIIGLEHPFDVAKAIGVVRLINMSLCGSGIGKRSWGDSLHHILDARTGMPTSTSIAATWAIAPTTVIADALASGLFFVDPKKLSTVFGTFYYVVMHNDGRVTHNIPIKVGELYR